MKSNRNQCILALLVLMSLCSVNAKASDYEVNTYRQDMNMAKQYEQTVNSSPYGSAQQNQARQIESQYESNAVQVINSPNSMRGYYASQIESILREFDQDYSQSPYASVVQQGYDAGRQSAAAGLQVQAIAEIEGATSYDQAIAQCLDADTKFSQAPYASVIQNAFQAIRSQGWDIAAQKVTQFSNYAQDFRQIETIFVNFQTQASEAPYASLKQNFYNSSSKVLSDRELAVFNSQSYQMSFSQLGAIFTEYGNKYSQSPYNSLSQQLYGSIRDAASNRMSNMGPPLPPQPLPPPPPQPFPPQPFPPQPFPPQPYPPGPPPGGHGPDNCLIRMGTNGFGQTVYRVTTHSGAIFGPFNTYQDAQAYEFREPQCYGPGFGPGHGPGQGPGGFNHRH